MYILSGLTSGREEWKTSGSWEDIKSESLSGQFVLASNLPDEFVAMITDVDRRDDSRGRECIFLDLELEDGTVTRVKYTKSMWGTLADSFLKLGYKGVTAVVGARFRFRRLPVGRGFPRHFPIEAVSGGKKR